MLEKPEPGAVPDRQREMVEKCHTCACSVTADLHALLVVARRRVVGVNDGVRGDAIGVVGLGPIVDGVDVSEECLHVVAIGVQSELGERGLEIGELADGSKHL